MRYKTSFLVSFIKELRSNNMFDCRKSREEDLKLANYLEKACSTLDDKYILRFHEILKDVDSVESLSIARKEILGSL